MKKTSVLLVAAALSLGIAAFAPVPAQAGPCETCAATGQCFPCCKCDGGSTHECILECGSLDATSEFLPTVSFDEQGTCANEDIASNDVAPAPTAEAAPATAPAPAQTTVAAPAVNAEEAP